MADSEIHRRLPHRPPFVWVDRIVSWGKEEVVTEKFIGADLDIFQGHYPDYPILPGVIICEALFQSGALLIGEIMAKEGAPIQGVPVVTWINRAKFKRQVRPETMLTMNTRLTERVGPAWFMSAKAKVEGKLAAKVDFACTLAPLS